MNKFKNYKGMIMKLKELIEIFPYDDLVVNRVKSYEDNGVTYEVIRDSYSNIKKQYGDHEVEHAKISYNENGIDEGYLDIYLD